MVLNVKKLRPCRHVHPNLASGQIECEQCGLKITTRKAAGLVLPANEKADPLTVDQRGTRGITEGHCSLSVYEGTPLFSGSVTMGTFPK